MRCFWRRQAVGTEVIAQELQQGLVLPGSCLQNPGAQELVGCCHRLGELAVQGQQMATIRLDHHIVVLQGQQGLGFHLDEGGFRDGDGLVDGLALFDGLQDAAQLGKAGIIRITGRLRGVLGLWLIACADWHPGGHLGLSLSGRRCTGSGCRADRCAHRSTWLGARPGTTCALSVYQPRQGHRDKGENQVDGAHAAFPDHG